MSSHMRKSTPTEGDDDDAMDIDSEIRPQLAFAGRSVRGDTSNNSASLLRDAQNWLGYIRALRETDVIILLTPVVIPISTDPTDISDPFEPFGRSLANRHARIRHVPYTQRNGITSTHLGFIKRGHVIILCFAPQHGEQAQLDFADVAFAVSDNKPCIIVVFCSPVDPHHDIPFPTVIQTAGYSPPTLEATAALIFGEHSAPSTERSPDPSSTTFLRPRLWPVEQWNEARDMASILDLWSECISGRFTMDHQTLASLLRRPGYAKHYVVRDVGSGEILGFCATYLSYVDQEGERLIASLAILLVKPASRQQGIGLSLHSHAITQLKRTRGVMRLQLGSTFPRILFGPPSDIQLNEEWFRRRGWQLNRDVPGQGQAIHDMILDFAEWRYAAGAAVSPNFRLCTQEDMVRVLDIVESTSTRQAKMGWFDQYGSLMNGPNVKDVVLALDNGAIVAAALTYTPSCGSPIASNLPWAGRIGNDVGGVTCICISPTWQDAVLVGLLDACIQNLHAQGMKKMFIDAVANEVESFTRLGFREWARYRDVWKDV